ncbi:4-oxalomesaconate tautomerase [Streptomyces sp. TP-A0874]|uniref:4-oxalomesaconate tautomerase n=1 Tax=Streptomyces sp. TP-A0874 TaxID=549819 RepID=UPI000852CF53|nr:4-oxalomesaconate tautomerase [Streptomyces sp. TP-A0874]
MTVRPGSAGVPCMLVRGGTSKGAFFLAEDLPSAPAERDALLLRVMGSPDERQIDGIGGGHPLTSKVAVVSASQQPETDVDYLFLQVGVERATVSDRQNCGNILAGVGAFAIERGLVPAADGTTRVRINLVNSGGQAVASVATPGGTVRYDGDVRISGVPEPAAPVLLDFADTAGSACGRLLPTGAARDVIDGAEATCVDNGMPVVVLPAAQFGLLGYESPTELEGDTGLRQRLERIRLRAGELMGLGDVTEATVPKLTLVAPAREGGTIATRTFIPHRCHASIGVLGAVTVATACALPGSPAGGLASAPENGSRYRLEHPSGHLDVEVELGPNSQVVRSGVVRTARKLFDGLVFPRP